MTTGAAARRRQRARGTRGAVLVEAAFVLPLFLLLIFGMIEFGYAEYLDSQSSSAARDGARVGILDPTDTDGIRAAVRAKLVGLTPDTITITCLAGLSGNTTVSCSDAEFNQDRIRVHLSDARAPLTPVGSMFGSPTLRGTATMVITGLPVVVSPPPPVSSTTSTSAPLPGSCLATTVIALPSIERNNGNGKYPTANSTIVTVTTNGAATCSALRIEFPDESGPKVVPLTPLLPPATWTYTLGKHAYVAEAGTHEIRVLDSAGQPIGTFQLTL
jgi:Flp pilus assembly protein TadG